MLLVVNVMDAETQCWIEEKQLLLSDLAELVELLDLEDFAFNAVYDLAPGDLRLLEDKYGVEFENKNCSGELCIFQRKEFFPENSHTGRELLLMLAGRKPMAAFVEEYPSRLTESFIPETNFDPHVAAGRFSRQVEIFESKIGTLRRVCYAVHRQEWRMESYMTLWRLAEKHGWNDGFEKFEGFLLGYDTEIDPFFDPDKPRDGA